MAIVNRDLDPSQQVQVHCVALGAVATGVTTLVALVPNSCTVVAAGLKAFGLSGAPQYSLSVLRATSLGPTSISLGATLTAVGGLSAVVQGFSISLGASTPLQGGDVIIMQSGVANTAIATGVLTVAFKPLQDVQTYFGSSIS
jgi:hypothetical protein